MLKISESQKSIYKLKQIPKAVQFIKITFAEMSGIKNVEKDVGIAIRVLNRLVVYIYIDHEVADKCESDLILPKEAGIKFENPTKNEKRFPRLWLEEYAAQLKCEREIAKQYPGLTIEWVSMIRMPDNSVVPL